MTWTHALPGSYLTLDQTGARKPRPTLWLPQNRRLFIPEDAQEHARPVLVLRGGEDTPAFALLLYRSRIEGQCQGERRVIARL